MSTSVNLMKNQSFNSRAEIRALLGGNLEYGITLSTKIRAILLFANDEKLYKDYFYPKGKYDNCLYTGIGQRGHQDDTSKLTYSLNIAVLSHKKDKRALLVFEKKKSKYYFVGKYDLIEMYQNIQHDADNKLRRVFIFHIKKMADAFSAKILC